MRVPVPDELLPAIETLEGTALTGLPFVYAVWAGRPDAASPADVARLRESLRQGLAHRGEIARAWAAERGMEAALCESYLTHNIRYQLGAEELSGAAAFLARAQTLGAVPPGARIRFFDDGRPERPITNARTAAPLVLPQLGRPRAGGQASLDSLLSDAAAAPTDLR